MITVILGAIFNLKTALKEFFKCFWNILENDWENSTCWRIVTIRNDENFLTMLKNWIKAEPEQKKQADLWILITVLIKSNNKMTFTVFTAIDYLGQEQLLKN